mmetsp:Transcript_15969/g.24168  ORF Transcript_15969/g.24168 Transcript_15969/m.24168 type:complete len:262 (-) Transcript_15969:422-1207(-)
MCRQHGLCPLSVHRTMALSFPTSRSSQRDALRNLWQTVRVATSLVTSRSRKRMARSHAAARDASLATTPLGMANGSRASETKMASTTRSHSLVTTGRSLLSRSSIVEKTWRLSSTLGVFVVPSPGAMEVCALFAILLLFSSVSKCVLAHCSQTRVLQTQSILVVLCRVRWVGLGGPSRGLARSALVRFGAIRHSTLLLQHGRVGRGSGVIGKTVRWYGHSRTCFGRMRFSRDGVVDSHLVGIGMGLFWCHQQLLGMDRTLV